MITNATALAVALLALAGWPSEPAPAQDVPPLHVMSFTCEVEHDYLYARGEVRNVSGRPIDALMAVAELRQADGTLVKTADSMVDYLPLMPGQTSPFEALTRHNPLATKCALVFKTMFGPQIPYSR